jgi:predicted Zn-dependent protease
VNFLKTLGDQELISPERQDPYVRSHPLTRERIATIKHHLTMSSHAKMPESAEFKIRFARARAKLYSFTYPFKQTLRIYTKSDTSTASRYARAIANFRRARIDDAVTLVDSLLVEAPNDPYFNELKGQILFESGQAGAALRFYQLAAQLVPDSPLILRDLARVQMDIKDPPQLDAAIANLSAALILESTAPFNWRLLAIAQGRKGDKGRSALALGEEALLINKPSNARFHAGLARKLFKEGSREWLQAEDILAAAAEFERAQSRNTR